MRSYILVLAMVATFGAFAMAQQPDLSRHPKFGPPPDPLSAPPPMVDPHTSPTPPSPLAPRESRVWKCSKCGAVLGQGTNEPAIERCPHCGAKLTSWFNYWI